MEDTYFVKIHTISIQFNSIIFRQTQPITLKKAKAYLCLVKYLSSSLILGIFLKQLNSWELVRQGTDIESFSFQLGLLIQFQGCSVSFTIKNKIHQKSTIAINVEAILRRRTSCKFCESILHLGKLLVVVLGPWCLVARAVHLAHLPHRLVAIKNKINNNRLVTLGRGSMDLANLGPIFPSMARASSVIKLFIIWHSVMPVSVSTSKLFRSSG